MPGLSIPNLNDSIDFLAHSLAIVLFGFKYKNDSFQSSIDYSYASPWLYINNGLLTSYTHNNFPLGFRNPHSQSLDILLNIALSDWI